MEKYFNKLPEAKNPLVSEVEKIKQLSAGDVEIFHYLINKKIEELIDKKKKGEITREELLKQRSIFDEQIVYSDYTKFKQAELVKEFEFEGNNEKRNEVIEIVDKSESISQKGGNQKGIFDLPDNLIVKVVSLGNYAYELPLVKITQNLTGGNIIKTYDVFEHNDAIYIVQDKASGKDTHEYSKQDQENIPQEHYDELVKLVNLYAEHGVGTDPSKISNLFYDPQKGFTVIDLGAATYQRKLDYHINGYFTNNLSKEKIENAIKKYGEYRLKPILPTLEQKLKTLNL